MKQRIPRTAKEAIEDTIALHEEALRQDKLYSTFKHDNGYECPLCLYYNECNECLWVKFTLVTCSYSTEFDYNNSLQSIIRLKDWLTRLEEK